MKVKDLIKLLEGLNQNAYVVVSDYNGAEHVDRLVLSAVPLQPGEAARRLSDNAKKVVKNQSTVILTPYKDRSF